MGLLEELVRRETFAEILALMRPLELVVAALRLEGLTDEQIGELLGVDRTTIIRRMARAQERIAERLPEARDLIGGRALERGAKRPRDVPLERGWLGAWEYGWEIGDANGIHPADAPDVVNGMVPGAGEGGDEGC